MVFTDFIVKYDPEKDTEDQLGERILYSLYIRRTRGNKPTVTFIGGDSGEGKSYTYLTFYNILCKLQDLNPLYCMDTANVYIPIEYPKKIKRILNVKEFPEYKKLNIFGVHEARTIVKSKRWYEFLPQAIADINAMSRGIKPLMIFIISQFIRDITSDVRYTLTYYITVTRPLGGNKRVRARFSVIWKDDRDLEKPRLRKRRLSGYIVYPDGHRVRFTPRYLELKKPSKELITLFDEQDTEAKLKITNKKIDDLIKSMEKEINISNPKIEAMIKYYTENLDSLKSIGKQKKRGFILNDRVKKMHDLTDLEIKEFQTQLNTSLKDKGLFGGGNDG